MIHENLSNLLRKELPKLSWSINFFAKSDDTGTVYDRGGSGYMRGSLLLSKHYQVFIRSSDWGLAEYYAYRTSELLEGIDNENWKVNFYDGDKIVETKTVRIRIIRQIGDILFLGINDSDIAEYSINFNAVLEIIKEERK